MLYLLEILGNYLGVRKALVLHSSAKWNILPATHWSELFLIISLAGWLLLGPLTAILLPAPTVRRIHPLFALLLGALIGLASIAILITCLSLMKGELPNLSFTNHGAALFYLFAAMIGAPSGFFYVILIRCLAQRFKPNSVNSSSSPHADA